MGAVRDGAEAVHQHWQQLMAVPVKTVPAIESRQPGKAKAPHALPKNHGAKLSPSEQAIIEGKIITSLRDGGLTKKNFYRRIGPQVKFNSTELDRVLVSMEARGLICRHQTDKGTVHYKLA